MGRNNEAAEVLLSHQGDGITSSVDLANKIKDGRSNWEKIMDLAAFLSQISIKKRYLTESQQIEACKKYISELIKRYCEDSNAQEILYMAFGILEGYQNEESVHKRREEYLRHMENRLADISVDTTVRRVEDPIIDNMARKIAVELNANNGKLGSEISVDEGLVLAKPEYTETNPLWRRGGPSGRKKKAAVESAEAPAETRETPIENEAYSEPQEHLSSVPTPSARTAPHASDHERAKRIRQIVFVTLAIQIAVLGIFALIAWDDLAKESLSDMRIGTQIAMLVLILIDIGVGTIVYSALYKYLRLWKRVDDKIHQNPAYGFMVAQAIDNAIAETGYGEHLNGDISYRLIKGFLVKTREAQEEPKYGELTGIRQWFEREDMTATTLEYRSYADAVMDLLKGRRWRVLGVALTPATSSWRIKSYSDPSLSFIVPNSKKRLSIWNVYGFQGDTQVVEFAVGFNIYNMDFGIINLNDSVLMM